MPKTEIEKGNVSKNVENKPMKGSLIKSDFSEKYYFFPDIGKKAHVLKLINIVDMNKELMP